MKMQRNTNLAISIASLAALIGISAAGYNRIMQYVERNSRIEEAMKLEFNEMYGTKGSAEVYCPEGMVSPPIVDRCNESEYAFVNGKVPIPVGNLGRIDAAHIAEIGRQIRSELEKKIR